MSKEITIKEKTFKVVPANDILAIQYNQIFEAQMKQEYALMLKLQVIYHTGMTEEEFKSLTKADSDKILDTIREVNKENFQVPKNS